MSKSVWPLVFVLVLGVASCRPATIQQDKELPGDDQRALVLIGISNPDEVFENSYWEFSWSRDDANEHVDSWTGRSPGYGFFIDGYNVTEERIEGTQFYLRRTNPGQYSLTTSSRTQNPTLIDVLGADSGAGTFYATFPRSLGEVNLEAETVTYIGTYEVKKGSYTCLYASQVSAENEKASTFIERYSSLGMPLTFDVPADFRSSSSPFCKRIQ